MRSINFGPNKTIPGVVLVDSETGLPGDFGVTSGALTDRSGTITTGGTAQNAAAALLTRKYLYIENPITATERLWFSTTVAAVADSPSISLEPGQSWENPAHFCPTGALSVIAATTGHKFTAREA